MVAFSTARSALQKRGLLFLVEVLVCVCGVCGVCVRLCGCGVVLCVCGVCWGFKSDGGAALLAPCLTSDPV